VAWDTQLSLGDVRALGPPRWPAGLLERFLHGAGQAGKPVGGALSARSIKSLTAYLEKLGVELHGDAYIFRNRSGQPYTKDTLG